MRQIIYYQGRAYRRSVWTTDASYVRMSWQGPAPRGHSRICMIWGPRIDLWYVNPRLHTL